MSRATRSSNYVETRTTKPTLMTRLKGRNAKSRTTKTTTKVEPRSHVAATHHTTTRRTTRRSHATYGGNTTTGVHHRRHATMGDKISGGWMRLKGSLTRRPGLKSAGARRMHGTDGRGSHRVY